MLPTLRGQFDLCNRVQRFLGVGLVMMLLAFYLFGYRPSSQRRAKIEADTLTQQRELRASKEKTRDMPSIANEVRLLRQQLERWKSLPKSQDLPQFILDVNQLSRQAALKNYNYKMGTKSWNDQYWELPIAMTFEGDFTNFYAFMRNVEDMKRQTRVKSMSVKSKDSRDSKSGQVQIEVTMNIYFSADQ